MRCVMPVMAALATILLLQSCSGTAGDTRLSGTAPAAAGLPSLTELRPLPFGRAARPRSRSTITLHKTVQYGQDYRNDLAWSAVGIDGENLAMNPAAAAGPGLKGCAFAIFSFEHPDPERLAELHVIWASAPAAANVWLALPNFDSGRWELQRPQREVQLSVARDSLTLPQFEPYISPLDDKLYVAVLLQGGGPATLRKIRAGDPYVDGYAIPGRALAPATIFASLQIARIPGSAEGLAYAIDFNNDGVVESTQITGQYIFNEPGVFEIALSLTNEEGLTATDIEQVEVLTGTWASQTIAVPDSEVSSHFFPRAASIDGRAAAAFLSQDNGAGDGDPPEYAIDYMIAADPAGSSWLGPFRALTGNLDDKPLAMGDLLDYYGQPLIFFRSELGFLYFILGDTAEPASWTTPQLLEGGMSEDSGIEAAMVQGTPAVAYSFSNMITGWYCWYRRADPLNIAGTWSTTVIGPGIGDVGLYANDNQAPSLLVHLESGVVTHYHASTLNGESAGNWIAGTTTGSTGPVQPGDGPALLGLTAPYNTFFAVKDQDSIVRKSVFNAYNFNPSGGGGGGIASDYDSYFQILEGITGIDAAFIGYDSELGDLGFTTADILPLDGIMVYSPGDTVDSEGDVGKHVSACVVGGLPLLFYDDSSNRSLKVARLE